MNRDGWSLTVDNMTANHYGPARENHQVVQVGNPWECGLKVEPLIQYKPFPLASPSRTAEGF